MGPVIEVETGTGVPVGARSPRTPRPRHRGACLAIDEQTAITVVGGVEVVSEGWWVRFDA